MDIIFEELSRNMPAATTANLTYYISTTGNDDNNGLTVDTPFATIAKALSLIPPIVDHVVTINLADGNYDENVEIEGFYGIGNINLIGNDETPANVTITTLDINNCHCTVMVKGLKVVG